MKPAPIVLFAYNRPGHLQRTLKALAGNILFDESELFIFSDGAKYASEKSKIDDVRRIIIRMKGCKKLDFFTSNHNKGLANSIIAGVTTVFHLGYDKLIVLEDDIITAPNFLVYMNACLDAFRDRKDIFSISGYGTPIDLSYYFNPLYLSPRPGTWGWGTWVDRWSAAEWSIPEINPAEKKGFNAGGDDLFRMLKQLKTGKVDSWGIRIAYHNYKNSLYTVYPCVSKTQNIGTDGSGVHFRNKVKKYDVIIDDSKEFTLNNTDVQVSDMVLKKFKDFYRYTAWKKFKLFILDNFVE